MKNNNRIYGDPAMKKSRLLGAVCACVVALNLPSASASLMINIVESGGNVEASYFGSLDLSATQGYGGISNNGSTFYNATNGIIAFSFDATDYYDVDISSWTSYGSGGFGLWNTSTGDALKLFGGPFLGVPIGYVSGEIISGSATKLGSSFASLGFITGSYVSTLTNGSITDTVIVNISAVPAPAAVWLFGSGLLGLIGIARRKKTA